VLWSLSVEEIFYLAFPIACLLFRTEGLLLVPLLGLIVIGPINRTLFANEDPWGQYAYLSCMDGIAFGCLAALICARWRLSVGALRLLLTSGATMAALVILLVNEDSHTGAARYGLNITALEAGIALMLVAFGSGVGNGSSSIGTGWLRAIGRSSYEIYLFHMFVLLGLMNLFQRLHPVTTLIPLWYGGMLLLSIVLGLWVSRRYSEPLNRRFRSDGRGSDRSLKSLAVTPANSTDP